MKMVQWCSYQHDDVTLQGYKSQRTLGVWGQKSCQELCSARSVLGVRSESVWDQLEAPATKADQTPLDFQRLQAERASMSWYFSATWHQEQRKKHWEDYTEVSSLQLLRIRWVLLELYKDNEHTIWRKICFLGPLLVSTHQMPAFRPTEAKMTSSTNRDKKRFYMINTFFQSLPYLD